MYETRMKSWTAILVLVLTSAWMAMVQGSPAGRLRSDFDSWEYEKSSRYMIPTDDDDNDDASGEDLDGMYPTFHEVVKYGDKSPTEVEVEVYLPDDENDSMNFADIDFDQKPAMLQSNYDSELYSFGDSEYTNDCDMLYNMFGILCTTKADTTTTEVATTPEPKETSESITVEDKENIATTEPESTTTQKQLDATTKTTTVASTQKTIERSTKSVSTVQSTTTSTTTSTMAEESLTTITKKASITEEATTPSKPTTTSAISKKTEEVKSTSDKSVTSDDKEVIVPDLVPVTETPEKKEEVTTVLIQTETEPIEREDSNDGPEVESTNATTAATPSRKSSEIPTEKISKVPKQPMDTALPPESDLTTSSPTVESDEGKKTDVDEEVQVTQKNVHVTTERASEVPTETSAKVLSEEESKKTESTKKVESTEPELVDQEDTVPTTTVASSASPEDGVAPQAAQFSTVLLVVCVLSLLIVIILVIIIIVVVRARLKRRGKYDITSEVDSAEGAAGAEGGNPDPARGNGEKVVTVQYNDARS